jgi:prepilin-type N-terminal cleavage/methylation domain-containing protein/prepilin-type processing-associated H-X9-DG protein
MHRQVPLAPATRRCARAFTLVELLVVIAIIGVLVSLLLPAVQAAREAARRMNCQSNMRNFALAAINFENAKKKLPAAMGKSAFVVGRNGPPSFEPYQGEQLSWIVHVLPYMELQSLYSQFKIDGTTSVFNQSDQTRPEQAQPAIVVCPSDSALGRFYSDSDFTTGLGGVRRLAKGNYVAYAGPEHMNSAHVFSGAINPVGKELRQVSDGTSQTIMITEVRTRDVPDDQRGTWALAWPSASAIALDLHSGTLGTSWTASGRPDVPYIPSTKQQDLDYSNPPNSFGGGVYSADKVRKCTDSAGADIERMPCDHANESWGSAAPRSLHPGGVNTARVDGSVHWLSNDVNVTMLGAMICINDGITLTE